MNLRSHGTTVALLLSPVVAILTLGTIAVSPLCDESIPDSILASTRGSSTDHKATSSNASCSDKEAGAAGGGFISWEGCSADNTPDIGPPLACIICEDLQTRGTTHRSVIPGSGNYLPSIATATTCGQKLQGHCSKSSFDPTVYVCRYPVPNGQCGTLPKGGLYQHEDVLPVAD